MNEADSTTSARDGAEAARERPGGRAERVVSAVLQAATAELARGGFAALQIDAVAQIAGVARTTIYRRWPTKIALVGDAVRSLRRGGGVEVGDTGDLDADLGRLIGNLAAGCTAEKRGVWRMMLAETDQPEVAQLVRELRAELDGDIATRVQAAMKRGKLRPDLDVQVFVEALLGAVSSRLFIRGGDADKAYVKGLISVFLDGARLRAAAPAKSPAKAPASKPRRARAK